MKQIDISRMSPKEKQEAMNEVKVLAQLKKNLIFCDRREQKIRIFRVNREMRAKFTVYNPFSDEF